MKLDEKYFVPFLAIVALGAALLIVFFTVSGQQSREQAFKNKMSAQDSLKFAYMPALSGNDSLRVQSFPNSFVIVDFWATWTSSFSRQAHLQLSRLKQQYPGRLEVIAAVVEDKDENVNDYINRFEYSFDYVNGTRLFNRFGVPGVPTQLVYAPGGRLHSIFTGSSDSTRMDSLQRIIGNDE
jgi:thiol-disulfide isomerase/thioredoxin